MLLCDLQVQYVIQGYHKRREYIAAFLSHFGTWVERTGLDPRLIWRRSLTCHRWSWTCLYCRGVVEYDAEGFTKLTLLLMWKDFCFLVHGSSDAKHSVVPAGLSPPALSSNLLVSYAPCSGSAAVLPQGPAHPHLPVCVPLHQQRPAVLPGAEVLPLQPPLGRQRDGKEGQVSRPCLSVHLYRLLDLKSLFKQPSWI